MKTLLIVILSLALVGVAFLTRPSPENFRDFLKQQAQDTSIIKKIVGGDPAEKYLDKCKFNNRLLWTDVEKDGAVVYTGVFSHWIKRNPAK